MNKLIQKPSSGEGLQIICVLKGIFWASVITIFLNLIVSFLLQYTSLSEGLLPEFSTFIFFISMLLGATIGARSAGKKGLLHGLSVSTVYLILLLLIGLIFIPDAISISYLLKRVGYSLLSGILGGFIGIGLSAK